MIIDIIQNLKKRSNSSTVNNFYSGGTREAQDRLTNIVTYLKYYEKHPPKYILIGEAPGHRGCAQSGIPFTSLDTIGSLDFLNKTIGLSGGKGKERTSTIVWGEIGKMAEPPMLWNAFPFHPHNNNLQKSNRKPGKDELKEGLEYIKELQNILPNSELVAVGNVAYESMASLGLTVNKVRHPSFGGKAEFEKQMSQLIK